ncbi:MAG: IS91 family transposase [Oligoflexia bacterium]|nr:IS91 family transposase [Oligoflexia bacterium]
MADIFKEYRHLLGPLPLSHHKVIQDIINCRTSVLGGHVLQCDNCGHVENSYNSCRNRHCPKCQYLKQLKWIMAREEEILPCNYFHVVFTVPCVLNQLILQNKVLIYNLLFKAAAETLKEVAANPNNLGAEIGFFGILHTWGQNLMDHPHIHFIVTGGGLNKEQNEWISCREDYLLPVKILSQVFKGKFLDYLEQAFDNNQLEFWGELEKYKNRNKFKSLLIKTTKTDWVVYTKKPFGGPEQVIKYLGKYTHRIAISNYRLVKIENNKVFFKYKDYSDNNKIKTMSLDILEFMRRFLLHVLPKKFVRIRHFGFLGNRSKKEKLKICKIILNAKENRVCEGIENSKNILQKIADLNITICPTCKKGTLNKTSIIEGLLKTG